MEKDKIKFQEDPTYCREDLINMEPELLRALLRELVHHNIKGPFYPLIRNWKGETKPKVYKLIQYMMYDHKGSKHG